MAGRDSRGQTLGARGGAELAQLTYPASSERTSERAESGDNRPSRPPRLSRRGARCIVCGMPPPISVLVVDDHAVFADALQARLSGEPDLAPVGVAYSVAEATTKIAHQRPDVAVLDVRLVDGTGIEIADRARGLSPATQLVMLTATDSIKDVVDAMLLGVRGWLSKTVDTQALVRAIRGVHRGEAWMDPALLGAVLTDLLERLRNPPPDLLSGLTAREREVLDCLADGLRRADIAAQLQVSVNTIRSHIQSVNAKLGVHSTLEAAAFGNRARSQRPAVR